jgi:FMN phosphatase YigB (HAD superfamily)
MNNKLVLFDWGAVLLDSFSKEYSAMTAIEDTIDEVKPENDSLHFMFKKKDYIFWLLHGEEFRKHVEKNICKSKAKCTFDEFCAIYKKNFTKVPWFEDIIEITKKLQSEGKVKTGILSTMCEIDREIVSEKLSLDAFDYFFTSCDLGVRKPDSEIYTKVERITNIKPENILFFDDSERNITEAKKHEWNAVRIVGNGTETIRENCRQFLQN